MIPQITDETLEEMMVLLEAAKGGNPAAEFKAIMLSEKIMSDLVTKQPALGSFLRGFADAAVHKPELQGISMSNLITAMIVIGSLYREEEKANTGQ